MSGLRVVGMVVGALLALTGLGLALGGGGLLLADASSEGLDGRFASPTYTLRTEGHALVAGDVRLGAPTPGDWIGWVDAFELDLRVESTGASELFVGIGDADEVASYLTGVPHATVSRLGPRARDAEVDEVGGGTDRFDTPATATFWVASATGVGPVELSWRPEPGRWSLVVANLDGSAPVDVLAGATLTAGPLRILAGWLLGSGLVLLILAALLLVAAVVGRGSADRPAAPDAPLPVASTGADPGPGSPYPLRISARLDEPLSRWLWLVKWLLLLPHLIVLAFLWAAFAVLTIVAGAAILGTGRYPRSIFDFNLGVLRWTWRVTYYGYSALGTDRYPPFAFDAQGYPATLDVDYPPRLSRGLVLVKWWLLVLPHYLIVALFAGGGLTWAVRGDGGWVLGGGIIGVLVLLAALLLLLGRPYPRGVFDVVLGLNRWVYRVIVYAALMTDVYPPFRLDSGGADPGDPTTPPPPAPNRGSRTDGPLLVG